MNLGRGLILLPEGVCSLSYVNKKNIKKQNMFFFVIIYDGFPKGLIILVT